jgi:hypothetical protein
MDNPIIKSAELEAFRRMNERKAESISKKNLLETIANLPAEGINAEGLDWEIGKKSMSIKIEISRGDAVETLTWELKTVKKA